MSSIAPPTAHASSALPSGASAAQVAAWLRARGFPPKAIAELGEYEGGDVLGLSGEDCCELLGEEMGAKLHALVQQPPAPPVLTTSTSSSSFSSSKTPANQPQPKTGLVDRMLFQPIVQSPKATPLTHPPTAKPPPAPHADLHTQEHKSSQQKSKSGVDAKEAEAEKDVLWVCCWENQRFYPVLGWSGKLLPQDKRYAWSDCYGGTYVGKGSFDSSESDSQTQWAGKWGFETHPAHTDRQGWMYADCFDFQGSRLLLTSDWQKQNEVLATHFKPENSYMHQHHRTHIPYRVRKRRWVRAKRPPQGSEGKDEGKDHSREDPLQKGSRARTVACWENQRYYVIGGWSSQMLPRVDPPAYSDEDGTVALEKSDFRLPSSGEWAWDGTWRLDKMHTDSQGWQYATVWTSQSFSPQPSPVSIVRRRRWFRQQVPASKSK